MSYIMTGKALAARAVDIAQRVKTIYGYAMYGFQITDRTIQGKAAQNLNGWYTSTKIAMLKAVANQSPPTWGFDCVNLIKGILWGWTGDAEKEKGGAVYGSNGVPDTNADGMIGRCHNVTADFTSIDIGEAVWMSGHIGIYIGDGLAVECTPKWANGVQITAVHNIGKQQGFNGRKWTKHGKLPYVSYGDTDADIGDIEIPDNALGTRLLKKGCQGEDVRELQRLLVELGYNLGAYSPTGDGIDGDFGKATQDAVIAFQTAAGIEIDGQFGKESLAALKEAIERRDAAQIMEDPQPTYTVIVHGLSEAEKDKLLTEYPTAEVAKE